MSAAELRQAAETLRERAEKAQGGSPISVVIENCTITGPRNLGYIETMHPGVGLALADWLDKEAEGIESGNWRPCVDPALSVARLINGGAA